MKKLVLTFLALSFLFSGCKPKDTTNVATNAPPEIVAPAETPQDVITDGLKAMGYPFKEDVAFRVTGMPGGTVEDVRLAKLETTSEGKHKLSLTWKGQLATLIGNEEYECTAEGVYAKRVLNADVQPSFVFLPAKLEVGKKWNAKYTVAASTGQNLEVTSNFKIVGNQKIKVSLGEFDAVVVQESGTVKTKEINAMLIGKSWYANGIGLIKTEATQTYTDKAGKKHTNKMTFEAIPLPKK